MSASLTVSIALPFVWSSVISRNSSPPLSTVTLLQLCMLLQSTHEDRQGAEAPAEQGERIAKSPLQRTLTTHIMGCWAKHEGALTHISLKGLVAMLELQCAQRFPARPADPDSSVFAELFPAPQSNTHGLTCLQRRLSKCTSTGTLLVFCWIFPRIRLRLVSRRTFERLFSAGVLERPSPRCLPTLTVARFAPARWVYPWSDHVLTCKQYTGSIHGHNHLMDVVTCLSRDSKIGPVRVNRKVSTTGDGTRKQGDVEISNFPISLRDGLFMDVSFVCDYKGNSLE